MTINANTRISALLRATPAALEAIISLSPKFSKLRNPLLRKVIAGRTSIAMASKLGGCSVDDFFSKLRPLGFEVEKNVPVLEEATTGNPVPAFLEETDPGNIVELDVRPVIEGGKDPLNLILNKLKSLGPDQVMKIINSFEPTPLIHLLEKQGFEYYTAQAGDDLVHTFFHRKTGNRQDLPTGESSDSKDWDEIARRFNDNLVTIDVRKLEMPLPMHTILEALDELPEGKALFVYHKRVPVFLLPELEERGFSFRTKLISEGEVHLLIYKD